MVSQSDPSRNIRLLGVFVLCILAVSVELYFTRFGAGASGDAVHYVQGAINLRSGRGYSRFSGEWSTVPITGFPPLYSMTLAGLGYFFDDLFQAGRFFNAFCWGATIVLVCLILWRYTRSWGASLLAGVYLLVAQNMFMIHSWVMSEAFYIFLTLLSLFFLIVFLDTDNDWKYVVLSALFVGLSILTRYVGLAMLPAGCLIILWAGKGRWQDRFRFAVIFSMVGIFPFIVWMLRNSLVSNSLVNRQFTYHPIAFAIINAMINETVGWFFPLSMGFPRLVRRLLTVLIILTVPLGFLLMQIKQGALRQIREWRKAEALPWLLILFIPSYMLLLFLNTALLDASTSAGGARRYLIPIYVMVVILVISVLHRIFWRQSQRLWCQRIILAMAMILAVFHVYEMVQIMQNPPDYIFGYQDAKRVWGDEVAMLQGFPPTQAFIANDVEEFYYLSGYPAYSFPIPYDQYTKQAREDFEAQLERARTILARGGVIVLIQASEQDERTLDLLNVQKQWESSKITIYRAVEP